MCALPDVDLTDYEFVSELGRGTDGRVVLFKGPTGGDFAVKFVPLTTDTIKAYYAREIDIMRQMTHPATLSCLGFVPFSEVLDEGIILMPFMANGSLSDRNREFYDGRAPRQWDATARCKAALGIAAGMHFIHSLGLLHRDLKPENILLDAHCEVRIADFGRSRRTDTRMTPRAGTPLTLAPEAYTDREYTNAVDVYSYAVCLYSLFAPPSLVEGRATPPTTPEQLEQLVQTGKRFVRSAAIPGVYWGLIERAWVPTPAHRPSFAAILLELRAQRAVILRETGANAAEYDRYEARMLSGLALRAEPLPPLELQPVTDRFTKVQRIAARRTGEVWTGRDRSGTAGTVCMKFIHQEGDDQRTLFARQVEVLARMTHPATLPMIGFAPGSPDALIVMPYMEHGSLDRVLAAVHARRAVPAWWDATAKSKAVIGMVAGMAFVHSLGLLHRDLEPRSVLIDGRCEVRIGHFGRARQAAADMTLAPGTAITQAPETYESGGYTNKVDVFSFGVTLYHFWADGTRLDDGRPHWRNWVEFAQRLLRGARWVRADGISDFYWQLITDCWEGAPENRPAFADILGAFGRDRRWIFPGADLADVAEYERRVRCGVAVSQDPAWPRSPDALPRPQAVVRPDAPTVPQSPVGTTTEDVSVVHRKPSGTKGTEDLSKHAGSKLPLKRGSDEDRERRGVVSKEELNGSDRPIWKCC
jgi:serine/threonine protein kinase